jgi:hypothetical protein
MAGAKPFTTPMQAGQQLSKTDVTQLNDPHLHCSIVGVL